MNGIGSKKRYSMISVSEPAITYINRLGILFSTFPQKGSARTRKRGAKDKRVPIIAPE
jgi:hypothetical protein